MPSTFHDMYADLTDDLRHYTAVLPLTERRFMRLLSAGMQDFQRETRLVEVIGELQVGQPGRFPLPADYWRMHIVEDAQGHTLVMNSPKQYDRNKERAGTGYMETPYHYSRSVRYAEPGVRGQATARLYTVWAREIQLYPDNGDQTLKIYYIPLFEKFSQHSPQWSDWWPAINFETLFTTTGLNEALLPYEDTFLDYCKWRLLEERNQESSRIFARRYEAARVQARLEKPLYFSQGQKTYALAPYTA